MSKVVQAFLVGLFFTFIFDYLLFLGMFLHYIKVYEIPEYYNILFTDHQNFYFISISILFFAFISTYLQNKKFSFGIIFAALLISASALIPPFGHALAKNILYKEDQRIQTQKHIFKGTLYYESRDLLYFYDDKLQKMIQIPKKDLKK